MAFADTARRLAGLSSRLFGWRPDDFWNCTPAELAAILAAEEPGDAALSRADLTAMMERDGDG
jgi:uncharacterized phage protein (TIGR02216 family)